MNLNRVIIAGRVTRDPELRSLTNGTQVANLGLATNEYRMKDGERTEQTEFHNVVIFGRLADTVAWHLKKGRSALIEGRIQTRSWEKDGQKQYRTEIVADRIEFGPKPSAIPNPAQEQHTDAPPQPAQADYPQENINPDDIPF